MGCSLRHAWEAAQLRSITTRRWNERKARVPPVYHWRGPRKMEFNGAQEIPSIMAQASYLLFNLRIRDHMSRATHIPRTLNPASPTADPLLGALRQRGAASCAGAAVQQGSPICRPWLFKTHLRIWYLWEGTFPAKSLLKHTGRLVVQNAHGSRKFRTAQGEPPHGVVSMPHRVPAATAERTSRQWLQLNSSLGCCSACQRWD